ncbi:MAG: N-acetylmuramoyl-L-alanine amidase [Mariprofundaceae bacterium]|nr:N-acetylmuramoyl-L-alanine amidase [Mariprofundaceae bacterium]
MRYFTLLILLFLTFFSSQVWAAQIDQVRLWTAPDHTRIVFYLNGTVKYRVSKEKNTIYLDLANTRLKTNFKRLAIPDSVVDSMREEKTSRGWKRLRIRVLEDVEPKAFLIAPRNNRPYRLVLDLMRHEQDQTVDIPLEIQRSGKIIVAVDAGHGGEDPGAIGGRGLQEKKVTLAVAKKLVRTINKHPKMHAFLTRKGNYFVPLRKRIALARKNKADLMVSIHADAVASGNARGASVYTLSEKGASDKIAAMLAKKENEADNIGSVMPTGVKDPVVKKILADLMKRASLNSALVLADEILAQVRKVGPIKYKQPKSARFVVLGAAEIPSVLVELDYISHPTGEKLLRSSGHQKKLASALTKAILIFLKNQGRLDDQDMIATQQKVPSRSHSTQRWKQEVDQPDHSNPLYEALTARNHIHQPSQKYTVSQRSTHVVGPGDTLWNISQRFETTVGQLKRLNHIKGNGISLGQKLRLP